MKKVKFFDENTRQWWMPDTGGSNIPALNDLLAPWGIEFGDRIFEGSYKFGDHDMYYASGTSIAKFPLNGLVITKKLKDQGMQILDNTIDSNDASEVPILGFLQSNSAEKSGRIVIYGDSNCIDTAHLEKPCYWMLDAIIEYTSTSHLSTIFKENAIQNWFEKKILTDLPLRMEGNRLYRYSKVLEGHLGEPQARALPTCPHLIWTVPIPLNISAPTNLYQTQKLLSLIDDVVPLVNFKQSTKGNSIFIF